MARARVERDPRVRRAPRARAAPWRAGTRRSRSHRAGRSSPSRPAGAVRSAAAPSWPGSDLGRSCSASPAGRIAKRRWPSWPPGGTRTRPSTVPQATTDPLRSGSRCPALALLAPRWRRWPLPPRARRGCPGGRTGEPCPSPAASLPARRSALRHWPALAAGLGRRRLDLQRQRRLRAGARRQRGRGVACAGSFDNGRLGPPHVGRLRERVARGDAAEASVREHVAVDVAQDKVLAELARVRRSESMRPSCTATTDAFGELIRSTSCSGCAATARAARALAAAAAAVGDGAGAEPGTLVAAAAGLGAAPAGVVEAAPAGAGAAAVPVSAVAPAVALDGDAAGSGSQATCLPVTGRRPSTRPVSVAITAFG